MLSFREVRAGLIALAVLVVGLVAGHADAAQDPSTFLEPKRPGRGGGTPSERPLDARRGRRRVLRAADGQWATIEGMSNVARSGKADHIAYLFTSSNDGVILRSYYFDYPKLYLKPSDPRPAGSQ